jgi:Zn-dependent protease with chaperone function
MTTASSHFPPRPANVPPELTAVSARYRWMVVAVLFCVLLFFVAYLGLVGLSAWLVYAAVTWPLPAQLWGLVLAAKIVVAFLAFLIFVFLVKGLFKRGQKGEALEIELLPREHPELFAFIRQVCSEVGSEPPHKVFVNVEVNAAARFSFLSLFRPRRKDLLLGLGLVNMINLTEFKALLAHEFGHFSQDSVKLDGYVYMAEHIAANIIYGRDWLDDFLEKCTRTDQLEGDGFVLLALLAWPLYGLCWLLRRLLIVLFHVLLAQQLKLSREQEFHADRVAVSVTGSDAPMHLLFRIPLALEALSVTLQDLVTAGQHHHLYTTDLFYHQPRAAAYLRRQRKDPQLGLPPPLPPTGEIPYLFTAKDVQAPVWSDHPSNFDRERSAKHWYIRSEIDERPPWLLFGPSAEDLRTELTRSIYQMNFRLRAQDTMTDAAQVQAFIDDERIELDYDPRYLGLYDNRIIQPGAIDQLVNARELTPWEPERLVRAHANLLPPELKAWAEEHNKRVQSLHALQAVVNGWAELKDGKFDLCGTWHYPHEAEKLLREVNARLDEDYEWLDRFDQRVFEIHYRMALQSGQKQAAKELWQRYAFHLGLQGLFHELRDQEWPVGWVLQVLTTQRQITADHFFAIRTLLKDAYDVLARCLVEAAELTMPALKNMKAGQPLRAFLLELPLLRNLKPITRRLRASWIIKYLNQFSEVINKVRRLHFKSLGAILQLQEKIAAAFLTWQHAPPAPVVPLPLAAAPRPLLSEAPPLQLDAALDADRATSSRRARAQERDNVGAAAADAEWVIPVRESDKPLKVDEDLLLADVIPPQPEQGPKR